MSKNLMIVESPGKAGMIEKYLGKDFRVMASRGHIRDIEGVGKNSMGVDFNNSYDRFEKFIKRMSEAEDVVFVTNTEFYNLFKDKIPSWK